MVKLTIYDTNVFLFKYSFGTRQYLKFNALTYVPFEKNLIDECLLTNEQVLLGDDI